MLSMISNALFAIIFVAAGLFMLAAPLDSIQKVFPKIASGKTAKIVGAVLLLCGVGMLGLLLMSFL